MFVLLLRWCSLSVVVAWAALMRCIVQKAVAADSRPTTKGTKHDAKYWHDLRAREHGRDNRTPAKPLERDARVYRYTNKEDAAKLRRDGVPPRTHMTSRGGPGRPPPAGAAQRREGLQTKPEARVTITVPAGTPVKKNRVMGGEPGRGEMTATKQLPPSAVEKPVPLRPSAR